MTEDQTTSGRDAPVDLQTALDTAHRHAREALADPEVQGATAVAWCSAHLTAVDTVLYREARRRAHASTAVLHDARRADHELQQAVNRLDRRLTGDTHLDRTPVEQVAAEVAERLRAHESAEQRLVTALSGVLDDEGLADLGPRLVAATASGPTRPHPHTPHTPMASLVGRLDAVADRVRDALDNRVPATGRAIRPPRPLGRWGSYLTGVPLRPPPDDQP